MVPIVIDVIVIVIVVIIDILISLHFLKLFLLFINTDILFADLLRILGPLTL